MTLTSPRLKLLLLSILLVPVFIFSRFYNLDKTARFLWDESSDLVRMRQIYVDRNITPIGPISEDGNKVFGSLSYYMLLPFAVAGNFDPASTAYGAAVWGIATGIVVLYLVYKVNRSLLFWIIPIVIFWYPLVETGRWAWNPNFIPLWGTLSLVFFLKKGLLPKFLSGLFAGLSIHLHYLAAFAAFGLAAASLLEKKKSQRTGNFLAFLSGSLVAILPFVVFDLTHPPGLFLSRLLYFNYLGSPAEKTYFFSGFLEAAGGTFHYFTQSLPLKVALIASVVFLVYLDIKAKSKALVFAGVFLIQLLGVSLVSAFYSHYMLPALVFFIVYVIYPRKNAGKVLSYFSLSILLVSCVYSFPKQITEVTWEGDISSTRYISALIEERIVKQDMKNVNVAVLSSPDPNTYGRKFRDLLLLKGISLKTKGEYEISDGLFVITTAPLETLRKDPAYELKYFREGPLVEEWEVPDSPWKVFLLSRPI